jgi:hypothetical protein
MVYPSKFASLIGAASAVFAKNKHKSDAKTTIDVALLNRINPNNMKSLKKTDSLTPRPQANNFRPKRPSEPEKSRLAKSQTYNTEFIA